MFGQSHEMLFSTRNIHKRIAWLIIHFHRWNVDLTYPSNGLNQQNKLKEISKKCKFWYQLHPMQRCSNHCLQSSQILAHLQQNSLSRHLSKLSLVLMMRCHSCGRVAVSEAPLVDLCPLPYFRYIQSTKDLVRICTWKSMININIHACLSQLHPTRVTDGAVEARDTIPKSSYKNLFICKESIKTALIRHQ